MQPLHHHDVIQVKVAAFAVSSFSLNFHRAGRKPFNPILGETYECVREDKGFKFIAEQVCVCVSVWVRLYCISWMETLHVMHSLIDVCSPLFPSSIFQVSHHPPIAACHCTSPNFNFWQG